MKDLLENPLMPFIFSALLFLICILVTRAIFSIPKFLKYQKAQTLLLIKIAEKNGVEENTIDRIIATIEPKANTPKDTEKNTITYINDKF